MRSMGSSTLRGGQTLFHAVRMWSQLFKAALMTAALLVVAVPAWNAWRHGSGAEWYAAGMVTLAEAKLALGYSPDSGQEIRRRDGTPAVLAIRDIAALGRRWRCAAAEARVFAGRVVSASKSAQA